MNTHEKMLALCDLSPRVGLRLHPTAGWYISGIEIGDGHFLGGGTPYGQTPDLAIDAAWTMYVEDLPLGHFLRVYIVDKARSVWWSKDQATWSDLNPE